MQNKNKKCLPLRSIARIKQQQHKQWNKIIPQLHTKTATAPSTPATQAMEQRVDTSYKSNQKCLPLRSIARIKQQQHKQWNKIIPQLHTKTATAPSTPATQAMEQRVDTSYKSNLPSYTPSTAPVTSAWSGTDSIDSYEDYLRNKETAYGSMKDETVNFYDTQNQQALAAIGAQQSAANAHAEDIYNTNAEAITAQQTAANTHAKEIHDTTAGAISDQLSADQAHAQMQFDLMANTSQEMRDQVHQFAEETKISDMNYAAEVYQKTVDAITAQMNSGMELAEETKQLLLNMSEEQRNAIYAAAENQRQQSEQNAEIERQRGVVDARSSYEQNKASYGANAESMGKMGLSGSGYGDYLTSRAYAQQRAETQNANARSETAKREARYIENQAKLDADSDYYQKKFTAEQDYANRKYDIDTTYRNNLLNADTDKLQRDHDAESTERESKFQADQSYSENMFNANSQLAKSNHEAETTARENNLANDTTYKTNLFEADSQARADTLANDTTYKNNLFEADSQARADALTAQQEADAGKFAADLSYRENMLNNDDAIGAYRQQKEEEAKAEAEQRENDYYSFYDVAKSGNYTAEEIRELASRKGFGEEEIAIFEKVAGDSISKAQAANNVGVSDAMGDTVGSILSSIQSQAISEADGIAHIKKLIDDKLVDKEEIDKLYNDGRISAEIYQQLIGIEESSSTDFGSSMGHGGGNPNLITKVYEFK